MRRLDQRQHVTVRVFEPGDLGGAIRRLPDPELVLRELITHHDQVPKGTREYIIDVLNQTYKGFTEFKDPDGNTKPKDCDCGDGYCGAYEDSYNCSADCGSTSTDSCSGNCGGSAGSCYCDSYCVEAGDCCADYSCYCGGSGKLEPMY